MTFLDLRDNMEIPEAADHKLFEYSIIKNSSKLQQKDIIRCQGATLGELSNLVSNERKCENPKGTAELMCPSVMLLWKTECEAQEVNSVASQGATH